MHKQSLDLCQEVLAFVFEQRLVDAPLFIIYGVAVHGWVVSVANKFHSFLEIFEKADVV
jgi:hypothetical protein